MKIIGLTGGIGSGKSSILKVFSDKGVPSYQSDNNAKKLMQEDKIVVEQIKATFGEDFYKDNKLDRSRLADLVFVNKSKLESLNAIIHPAVQNDFKTFITQQDAPYVIKEAAILFETGGAEICDAVILVTAPELLCIERVMQRESTDLKSIKARMYHQWGNDQKVPLADFVIDNIEWDKTLESIEDIHQKLLEF